jgi:hypothetical protein
MIVLFSIPCVCAARAYAEAAHLGSEAKTYAWEIQSLSESKAVEFIETLEKKKPSPRSGHGSPSDYAKGLEALKVSTQEVSLDEGIHHFGRYRPIY